MIAKIEDIMAFNSHMYHDDIAKLNTLEQRKIMKIIVNITFNALKKLLFDDVFNIFAWIYIMISVVLQINESIVPNTRP